MALTTEQKQLLREAICAGAFGNVVNGAPQGQTPQMRAQVTPQVLAAVAGMDDETILATLTLFRTNRSAQLTQQKVRLEAELAKINAQLG